VHELGAAMSDFLQYLRDLSNRRSVHWFAIGVQASGIVLFTWLYSVLPSNFFLVMVGWCCIYAAHSSMVLLAKGKAK